MVKNITDLSEVILVFIMYFISSSITLNIVKTFNTSIKFTQHSLISITCTTNINNILYRKYFKFIWKISLYY